MENLRKLILENKIKGIAYFYLFASFMAFTIFYAYNLRLSPFALGFIIFIISIVLMYVVYIIINHLLLRKIISHKLLLIVESVLLLTFLGITTGDIFGSILFVPIRF